MEKKYNPANADEYNARRKNWEIAIGLQAVDGLTPSSYLAELAQRNIEGELTFAEVEALLKAHYADLQQNISHDAIYSDAGFPEKSDPQSVTLESWRKLTKNDSW